jgi:hypothetical protein
MFNVLSGVDLAKRNEFCLAPLTHFLFQHGCHLNFKGILFGSSSKSISENN